jgi:hypothetical protein
MPGSEQKKNKIQTLGRSASGRVAIAAGDNIIDT